jgi:hypothetical protein
MKVFIWGLFINKEDLVLRVGYVFNGAYIPLTCRVVQEYNRDLVVFAHTWVFF